MSNKTTSGGQTSLFAKGLEAPEPKNNPAPKAPAAAPAVSDAKSFDREPATAVMKQVARRTLDYHRLERDFTPEEIEDILFKREDGEELSKAEIKILRNQYRKMKRWAMAKEKTNVQQIICVPSLMDDKGFYKLFEISALYYAYRLADRMGRTANLFADKDRFSKATNVASLTNIAKFVEQFKQFENPTLEITEDGIYVFTLKNPLTPDEIGELRRTEQIRRDNLHNLLRPKAMDPAAYQAILMIVRQIAPKVRKLDRQEYYLYGEEMLRDLSRLTNLYFDFSDGLVGREQTGAKMLSIINHLFACLMVLSENRVWEFDTAANIGENINELKRIITKNFKPRKS